MQPKDQSSQPIWLNVASGPSALDGFTNLDKSPFFLAARLPRGLRVLFPKKWHALIEAYASTYRNGSLEWHDCRQPLRYAPDTVSHILCSHFLEHVYPDEARKILTDFYEVLRPGGTVHIIVPSLREMARDYVERDDAGAADEFMINSMLSLPSAPGIIFRAFTLFGYDGLRHRWMYDKTSMAARLKEAGFEMLEENSTPSSYVRADDLVRGPHLVARKPDANSFY